MLPHFVDSVTLGRERELLIVLNGFDKGPGMYEGNKILKVFALLSIGIAKTGGRRPCHWGPLTKIIKMCSV